MASQEAAKEAKTQLKIDAHRIIKERTTQARKTNKQLRDQLIKHIGETRVYFIMSTIVIAKIGVRIGVPDHMTPSSINLQSKSTTFKK